MDRITNFMTRLITSAQASLQAEDGLSAMEYFVMMVGLVLVVFFAFQFLGGQITSGVHSFVSQVFGLV